MNSGQSGNAWRALHARRIASSLASRDFPVVSQWSQK